MPGHSVPITCCEWDCLMYSKPPRHQSFYLLTLVQLEVTSYLCLHVGCIVISYIYIPLWQQRKIAPQTIGLSFMWRTVREWDNLVYCTIFAVFGQPPTYVSVPSGPTTLDGASSIGYPLTVLHSRQLRGTLIVCTAWAIPRHSVGNLPFCFTTFKHFIALT